LPYCSNQQAWDCWYEQKQKVERRSDYEDLEALQKQWEAIQQEANSTRAPALLNRDDDFIQRVLRDMYTADVIGLLSIPIRG
jgi:Ribonuclease G/E